MGLVMASRNARSTMTPINVLRLADRLAFENAFGGAEANWPVGNSDGANTNVVEPLLHRVEHHRSGRQGEIAAAPGEFSEAITPLPRPGREADFGDDFVRPQCGDERSVKEIIRSDHARAAAAARDDFRFAGHRDGG